MKSYPTLEELREGGLLLVDKPYGWTSQDAITKVKYAVRAKIGHAGTLDPLATGLLICCTGNYTKRISEYQRMQKEYTGIIHLGARTETYDLESEPNDVKSTADITIERIEETAAAFRGAIKQTPPIHSAVKKDGKRAYVLARIGVEVALQERDVQIDIFELTFIEPHLVGFRVACSTGTYIRSLANDFGSALGCGGYLKELRRTSIGGYDVADALTPDAWFEILKAKH